MHFTLFHVTGAIIAKHYMDNVGWPLKYSYTIHCGSQRVAYMGPIVWAKCLVAKRRSSQAINDIQWTSYKSHNNFSVASNKQWIAWDVHNVHFTNTGNPNCNMPRYWWTLNKVGQQIQLEYIHR